MHKNIRIYKTAQYTLYIASIVLVLLTITCTQWQCADMTWIPYQEVFRPIFMNITDSVWKIDGVSFFLILQTVCLVGFFGIGLYLSLKILPVPLSEKEKKEISLSPYAAFNNIIFSKILFGKVALTSAQIFDLRSVEFITVADLYLFHFKSSNAANVIALISVVVFIMPHILDSGGRASYVQLAINFLHLNLSLLVFLNVISFVFCKFFIKDGKDV